MAPPLVTKLEKPRTGAEQLARTVEHIAAGIRSGSVYPPLLIHARNLAARAPRKDYARQLREVYRDFLKRWRYTRDPVLAETVTTSGDAIWGLTWGGNSPRGIGAGDCDEATAAMGAAGAALGLVPRIVVMAAPGRQNASHVYPEFLIPGRGWIPADPVAAPRTPFGKHPPAQWRRRFDLYGRPVGNLADNSAAHEEGADTMPSMNADGLSLERFGLAGIDGAAPEDMASVFGLESFGSFFGELGAVDLPGIAVEVEPDADGYAVTPIMELGIVDFCDYQRTGRIRPGALAGDWEGNVYQYQTNGIDGFFSKIFSGVKKIAKGAASLAKRAIKALPGGKYLVRFGEKLASVSLKLIKPLAKYLGPLAKKLAPIAALIPGFGPAIAVAMYRAGDVAALLSRFAVKKDKKTGLPIFKSKAHAQAFKAALKARALEVQRKPTRPGHIPAGTPQHAAALRAAGLRLANRPAVSPALATILARVRAIAPQRAAQAATARA